MKLEALKRQGQRTDLTSTPAACKLKGETADIVGKQAGESGDQVRRFIRLTYLIDTSQCVYLMLYESTGHFTSCNLVLNEPSCISTCLRYLTN